MTSFNANVEAFQKPLPVMTEGSVKTGRATLQPGIATFARLWRWLLRMRSEQTQLRRLRIVDRVTLGDKNAVAVVQIDGRRFLVGAAQMSVGLLAELQPEPPFAAALAKAPKAQRARSKKTVEGKPASDGEYA